LVKLYRYTSCQSWLLKTNRWWVCFMKSLDNCYNFYRSSAIFTLSDFYLSEVSFSENCLQSEVLSRDVPDAIRQSIPCCVRLKLRIIISQQFVWC
jgi:hypothetical protein